MAKRPDSEGSRKNDEDYSEASRLGPAHRLLDPLVGTWDTRTSLWLGTGQPLESTGQVVKAWVLGDRFLRGELCGTGLDGRPYVGVGYLGYDIGLRRYCGVWLSDVMTGIMSYSGQADTSGKVFTFTGMETDPLDGSLRPFECVQVIEGPDRHVLSFYYLRPDGKHKSLETVHTRRSAALHSEPAREKKALRLNAETVRLLDSGVAANGPPSYDACRRSKGCHTAPVLE